MLSALLRSVYAGVARRMTHAADRVDALDSLRGVAILMVLLKHSWDTVGAPVLRVASLDITPLVYNARFGVDLFFVLSGYLLFGQYVKRHELGKPQPSWRAFWLRRIKRVVPAYYLTIITAFLLHPALFDPANGIGTRWENLLSHLLFLHNLDSRFTQRVPAVWSLAPEMQFYLIMPLLAFVLLRGRWWRWNVAVGWLASVLLSAFFQDNDTSLPFRLNQFLIGFVAAAWLPRWQALPLLQRSRGALALVAQAAGATCFVILMFADYVAGYLLTPAGLSNPVWNVWAPLAPIGSILSHPLVAVSLAMVLAGAVARPDAFLRVWQARWLGTIGIISYGAFLWHGYAMGPLMQWFPFGTIGWLPLRILASVLIVSAWGLLAGWLSYVFVESPFLTSTRAGRDAALAARATDA